jgi:pectate lyase
MERVSKRLAAAIAAACLFIAQGAIARPDGALFPAFPGAEGAGAYTPGGRGGKVLIVTTLRDYDKGQPTIPGSLRAAIETHGPRIILFRISGNIDLVRSLTIREPFITIAGQTAPGDGICLRDWPLDISTHDVVIRYLRVRLGDRARVEASSIGCAGHNVIIDHCSVSFGTDQTLTTNGDSGRVTVQWCLITESLNNSVHHKGAHGHGSLISGTEPITYHHNLYAFHRTRNPRPGIGLLDFRNNVIYGWGDHAGYCGNDMLRLVYVNNWLEPAAYSKDRKWAFSPGGPSPRLYVSGNVFAGRPEALRDNILLIQPPKGMTVEDLRRRICVPRPWPTATVSTDTAAVARERVLNDAGATLPRRDAIDTRVMALVRSHGGRIIDSQDDVGGYPDLRSTDPPLDSDGDGMPDAWETAHGLNPHDPSDASRIAAGGGYTNVEDCIDGVDPRRPISWIYPPEIAPGDGQLFVGKIRATLRSRTAGSRIRYTLDGSEPGPRSALYTRPVEISASTTLRARAFRNSRASHVTTALFTRTVYREPAVVRNAAPGLDYAYYENGDWSGFPDLAAFKPVSYGVAPIVGIGPSRLEYYYGLKFTGYVDAPRDGLYTFYGRSTDQSQLAIDGRVLVRTQSRKREISGRVLLRKGLHAFEASTYFDAPSTRVFVISYEGPGIAEQPIPAAALFHAAPRR